MIPDSGQLWTKAILNLDVTIAGIKVWRIEMVE